MTSRQKWVSIMFRILFNFGSAFAFNVLATFAVGLNDCFTNCAPTPHSLFLISFAAHFDNYILFFIL